PIFQDSSTFLAKDKLSAPQFPMRQDITLTDTSGKLVIVDCKYKLLENGKPNPQDLYQLATYAIRRACQRVFIIYPTLKTWDYTPPSSNSSIHYYTVTDELAQRDIQIGVLGIPFGSVKGDFEELTQILKQQVNQLLMTKSKA
ncbi:MAG: 5-methylcytosine restriction system specificity protein McrC, partial [Chitinophagales bacterium]